MVFDRGVREAPREWLNLESTEFLARRLYGMERAFSEVRKESVKTTITDMLAGKNIPNVDCTGQGC